jgi:cold shock CspA family protein
MALRRFIGTVISFNRARGFGFVKVDGPFPQAFVNISEFPSYVGMDMLGPGTRVEFYLENSSKGLKAIRANIV